MVEVSLEEQIEKSSLIVEGKVVAQESFWSKDHRNIYTRNTVEVYKVFKGQKIEYVDVITLGGVVGLQAQISSHSLQLFNGKYGVFVLEESKKEDIETNKGGIKSFEAYSGIQGFYGYDGFSNSSKNVFKSYKNSGGEFYKQIENISQEKMLELKDNILLSQNSDNKTTNSKSLLAVAITNISPTSIVAGEGAQLTITGSGFGATPGTIGFKNADDGGATLTSEIMAPRSPTPLPSQIIQWDDNTIIVEVPSNAGTGTVTVFHNSDTTMAESSQTLTVTHAEINVISGGNAYQVQHVNDNGSGGYTWEMFTDFFNDTEFPGARAAFERVIDVWRCETNINWDISSTATTIDVTGNDTMDDGNMDGEADEPDGTNVVRFDNGNELESGVLGRCTSWYSGCNLGNGDIRWFVSEMDIVFDDGRNWYFGSGLPTGSQFDFESVALHEAGHGHQLAHVIDVAFDGNNSDDVMNFSLSNQEQQRNLSSDNIAGGNSIQDRSTTMNPCPVSVNPPDPKFPTSVMIDSSTCNLSIEESELANAISIYPNPATTEFFIKNESFINLSKAIIYDVSGRQISEYDLSEASRIKNINVQGLSGGVYIINIHSDNAKTSKKLMLD
ncbi:hypothetical protein GCM10023315_14040 [Algibacter aquimarinus]|uniref:T9SS type A sorting domain-containing protein n=1 Tax=Algibacter aquimarinus TaxID=1136748 RepID=A0ABP9HB33_9FLAO